MKPRQLPHISLIRPLLKYNARTGRFSGKAGVRVGSGGYVYVSLLGTNYVGHRLAWFLHHGECPARMQIDHINGIRHDNRLRNLRLVTAKKNARNSKKRRDNTSGVTGVGWDKARRNWRAQIALNGKNKHLGSFSSIADAVHARRKAEKKYGFHPNHGRTIPIGGEDEALEKPNQGEGKETP